jgi:DNA polymerase-2
MKGKNEYQSEIKVFLISDEWNDFNNQNRLIFWGVSPKGPVKLVYNNRPVFFVDRSIENLKLPFPNFRKEVQLKSFSLNPVDAIYFNTQNDLLRASEYLDSQSIMTYESDINPTRRFLMERGINVQVYLSQQHLTN